MASNRGYRTEAQRRAIFANLQNRGSKTGRNTGRALAVVGGAIAGASIGAAAAGPGLFRVARVALPYADKFARTSKVHPVRVFKAAERLFPHQKGTYRFIRTNIEGPAAINLAGDLSKRPDLQSFRAQGFKAGAKRLRLVFAPRPAIEPRITYAPAPSRRILGVRRIVRRRVVGPAPYTTGPAIAHELGHLRPTSLAKNLNPETSKATGYVGNTHLKEEFLAHVSGYKIWRKAGGKRSHFIVAAAPAFSTYLSHSKAFISGASYAGGIAGSSAVAHATRRRR